jgi:L-rhamnose-H+ transport protein
MNPNPFLGVCFHWLGGLASGSFYVPYRKRQKLGVGNLLARGRLLQLDRGALGPRSLALTNDLSGVLQHTPMHTLFYTWMFGPSGASAA